MGRIVVGIDDSEGARRALEWALTQAAATGTTVEAMYVFERHLAWVDLDLSAEERARADKAAIEAGRRTLDSVVDEVVGSRRNVRVERCVHLGDVAPTLVSEAAGADLLVVGSHGRGAVKGLVLGSVSRGCTEQARCPVVVIPRSISEAA
jgi:nucleotide-binding universal stress UspA family protein